MQAYSTKFLRELKKMRKFSICLPSLLDNDLEMVLVAPSCLIILIIRALEWFIKTNLLPVTSVIGSISAPCIS